MNINIEAERARMQLTKEELAKRLGISQRTYVSYVRGTTPIPSDTLMAMMALFHCSADYLLGLTPPCGRSHSEEGER